MSKNIVAFADFLLIDLNDYNWWDLMMKGLFIGCLVSKWNQSEKQLQFNT